MYRFLVSVLNLGSDPLGSWVSPVVYFPDKPHTVPDGTLQGLGRKPGCPETTATRPASKSTEFLVEVPTSVRPPTRPEFGDLDPLVPPHST